MQVPQVDIVDAELLQRPVEGLNGPLRGPVHHAGLVALPVAAEAELRGEEDLTALARALEPAAGGTLSDML